MGLLDRVIGSKKEEDQDQQNKNDFWNKTKYGFAPKDSIKIHITPEREVYPKYPRQGDEAFAIAVSNIEEIHNKLNYLNSKNYNYVYFIRGKCGYCNNYFLIPESKKPIFFKCPFCSTSEEKSLIELLLFLNPENEIFGTCPKCNKYGFLRVTKYDRYINFYCKSCNEDSILNKDHPIDLSRLSDKNDLIWCSACGNLFEESLIENNPIVCPNCETYLVSKK